MEVTVGTQKCSNSLKKYTLMKTWKKFLHGHFFFSFAITNDYVDIVSD